MFRIGEFAQIAQVSGRQLRFYDELGLLKPDVAAPGGLPAQAACPTGFSVQPVIFRLPSGCRSSV